MRAMALKDPKRVGRNGGIYLDITEEIIETATRRDSSHCVVADALRAARPDVQRISVDLQSIRFTDPKDGKRYIFWTPSTAQNIVLGFDQGIRPEPARIRLGRPVQVTVPSNHNPKTGEVRRSGKAELEESGSTNGFGRRVITKNGGKPIAQGALSSAPRKGRRRTFGLRQLKP